MNGCVLSCGKTTMSWYIGACILTGNAWAHTRRCSLTQTEYTIISLFNSYDSWLSSSDVEGEVEEPPHPEKPWRVSTQMQTTSSAVPHAATFYYIMPYIDILHSAQTLHWAVLSVRNLWHLLQQSARNVFTASSVFIWCNLRNSSGNLAGEAYRFICSIQIFLAFGDMIWCVLIRDS